MPQTKKHYHDLINNTKIKDGQELHHPNGEIEVYLKLVPKPEKEDNVMTNNQLAKILNNVVIEMREGFTQVKQEIAEIKQEVTQVKQEVTQVKQEVTQVKQEIAEIKQDMNTMKIEINARLDKIEQRLDAHDAIFERNNLS